MDVQSFAPTGDNTPIAASVASASGALTGLGNQIRIYNSTAGVAFFRFTKAASTAVLTDSFVAPGATETFSVNQEFQQIAVILSTGTGTVYAQRGFGL